MKQFVWFGLILSWVFLSTSFYVTAGTRIKASDLMTSCNVAGFVNRATNSYVFAGCCYESIGGAPVRAGW